MDNSLSFAKRLKKLNKNSTKILLNEIGLDKESKEILYKRYVEEMSLVEIANELGYTKELMPIKLQMIADYLYEL